MKGLKQTAVILAVLTMALGTMPVQNTRGLLPASAEAEQDDTMLTIENYGDYAAVTFCDPTAVNVTIPSEADGVPVTMIDECAFMMCQQLETVSIPESVTSIKDFAFYNCESLESILIPDSVTELGFSILSGCFNLKSVTLSSNLTDLNDMAFMTCPELTEITLLEGITDIGYGTFSDCTKLTSIDIPTGVTKLEFGVFQNTGLTSITIPASVTSIDKVAFKGCSDLTDVYYLGTEAQWQAISIKEENDALLNANVHFMGASIEPETTEAVPETTLPETTTTEMYETTMMTTVTTDFLPETTSSEMTVTTTVTTETTDFFPETTTITTETTTLPPYGDGEPLYGDADDSGELDIVDVIALNKYLLLGESLSKQGEVNADVDQNGIINATDSLNILKAVVKIITLPVK